MNKPLQALLIALALAGAYCATINPKPIDSPISVQADKTVLLADGTDPFPKRPIR